MNEFSLIEVSLGVAVVLLAVGRAFIERREMLQGFFGLCGWIELSVIGLALSGLIVLGVLQIVLRNFFHGGLLWADPVMRHLVLWIGCLGAALATSRVRHINIDVFGRILPAPLKPIRRTIVYAATAMAAYVLAVAALRLVIDEREFGETAFGIVQTWTLQTVLPWAFLVMSYRSIVNLIVGREEALEEAME